MNQKTKASLLHALLLLTAVSFVLSGCSRIERVKVVNNFPVPIRVLLGGRETQPVIPARSERVLDGKYYIGGRVRVTILNYAGKKLIEKVVDPPGDSMSRPIALIVVDP